RSFADVFELARTFNKPDAAVGFFDIANLSTGPLRVMGVDQEMHFSWPSPNIDILRKSFREYVMRYFLRSADYSPPSAYYEVDKLSMFPFLRLFSWCPNINFAQEGFGYSQVFYGLPGGARGRFPSSEQYKIIDLRRLGPEFDWIVTNVKILNFDFQ